MPEKPILFSPPMVQAILDGRKSQTRRVIGLPKWADHAGVIELQPNEAGVWVPHVVAAKSGCLAEIDAPYSVGDILWVREAWALHRQYDSLKGRDIFGLPEMGCLSYKADGPYRDYIGRPRNARFMPRWASRLTLEVTGVRVERLQDISEDDAKAEGVQPTFFGSLTRYRDGYRILWDDMHDDDPAHSWDANPWVWVYEFVSVTGKVTG